MNPLLASICAHLLNQVYMRAPARRDGGAPLPDYTCRESILRLDTRSRGTAQKCTLCYDRLRGHAAGMLEGAGYLYGADKKMLGGQRVLPARRQAGSLCHHRT